MSKKWNTTKLIALGSLSVLAVFIWLPSAIILSITGNPLGVLLTFFTGPFISILTALIIKEFGAITLRTSVSTILTLPLPSVAPKILEIVNVIVRSFIVDILFYFLKAKEKLASIICGGVFSSLVSLLTYFLYLIIGVPGADKIPSVILTPIGIVITLAVIFLIGSAGGFTAYLVYKRIENTNIIRRIQGERIE